MPDVTADIFAGADFQQYLRGCSKISGGVLKNYIGFLFLSHVYGVIIIIIILDCLILIILVLLFNKNARRRRKISRIRLYFSKIASKL